MHPDEHFTLAILSDTHGELDLRIASAIADCRQVIHAGDIGSAAVLSALGRDRVVAVRGNNDDPCHWPTADHSLLSQLKEEATLTLPGGALVVVHGHRAGPVSERHDWLRHRYPQARLVVYGHSHILTVDQQSTPWVANPGAAGRDRTHGGPSCLLLHISGSEWRLEPIRFPPANAPRLPRR